MKSTVLIAAILLLNGSTPGGNAGTPAPASPAPPAASPAPATAVAPGPTTAAPEATAAFERLKTLAGAWRGSLEWTGARSGSEPISARYYLTGNGSAVVEDLESDGTVTMTSVYHLDGPDLRLTHYCGAGNQPRLRSSHLDTGAGHFRFSFVDVTNLKTPASGHVHGVELTLHGGDQITLTFTFVAGGRESYERIELSRVDP
jgi:hypothetical protein